MEEAHEPDAPAVGHRTLHRQQHAVIGYFLHRLLRACTTSSSTLFVFRIAWSTLLVFQARPPIPRGGRIRTVGEIVVLTVWNVVCVVRL